MGFESASHDTLDSCTVTHLDSDHTMLRRLSALQRVIIRVIILRSRYCMHSLSLKL